METCGLAEQQSAISLEDLDAYTLVNILKWLSPEEVVSASLVCKLLHHAAEAGVIWRHLYDTSLNQRVKDNLMPPPDQISDWRTAVIRGLMLEKLQYGVWERLGASGRGVGSSEVRPCPREGHAAASWGQDSMILFGGWGCGIRNDLYVLDRVYDDEAAAAAAVTAVAPAAASATAVSTPAGGEDGNDGDAIESAAGSGGGATTAAGCPPGSSGPSAAAAQGAAAAAAAGGAAASWSKAAGVRPGRPAAPWLGPVERPCIWRWRVPKVAGRRPAIRYGHSATRCGAAGEMLVVYGGMQSGGYTAEINSLAVLRPYSGAGASDGCPADCAPAYEYEWWHPELKGDDPGARGYHAACASPDGLQLFVFGGIARRDSITRLTVVDLTTWTVERWATTGEGPSPRFGCSLAVFDGRLWVVGGGYGSDLARSGFDLADCFTLDLQSREWSRVVTTNQPHCSGALGRCHASALVGCKLVLFGGSLDLGNDITWLDLRTRTWGQPAAVLGSPPGRRMSAVMALSGSDLLVFGGWIYSSGEMGDLSRLKLVLDDKELRRAKQCAVAAAVAVEGAGFAAGGPSGSTGRRWGGAAASPAGADSGVVAARAAAAAGDGGDELAELLNSKIALYYKLMRSTQSCDDSRPVPLSLVREMHETMMAIRLLRSLVARAGLGDEEEDEEEEEEEEEESKGEEESESDGDGREENDDDEEEEDGDVEVHWAFVENNNEEEEEERGGGAGGGGGSEEQQGQGAGSASEGMSSGDEYDEEETGEEETSSDSDDVAAE